MRSELISVIVPIHNVERYLAKCLNSLLAQTYSNLEIICVDDCSTDGSTRIAKEYAVYYERIRLICHDCNMGLGSARNTGLKQASGTLVGFVDSDDYVHVSMYEKLYRLLMEHRADIAQCSICNVDKEGEIQNEWPKSSGYCSALPLLCLYGAQDTPIFSGSATNKLYKKKCFSDHGIKYPSHYLEDIPTMVELLYYANSIASIDEGLYYYFNRSDSITNKKTYDHVAKLVSSQIQSKMSVCSFLESHKALYPSVVARYLEQSYYRAELLIDAIFYSKSILPEKQCKIIQTLLLNWRGIPGGISTARLNYIKDQLVDNSYDIEELKNMIMIELQRLDMNDYPSAKLLASLHYREAVCHVRLKQYELALKDFTKVIENDPTRLEIFLNRSDSLRYLCRFDEAFSEVDFLEAINSHFPGIWSTRAKIWKAMGETRKPLNV